MFKQKLANSKALRWGILLVVVLTLLVTTFVVVNAWLAPSHQVAFWPLIQSLGSWGG